MENKIKFGSSFKTMTETIKKSKGMFWTIIILILIPVVIMNCYSFYSAYNGTVIDYSQIEQVDFQKELLSGNFEGLYNAFNSVISFPEYEETSTDFVFEIINFLLSAFFDAIMIILASMLISDKKFKTGDLVSSSVKKLFSAIIFGFLGTWILTEVQSLIFSSTEYVAIFAHLASKGTIEALVMLGSAIFSSILQVLLAILVASMGMMLVSYMTIPVVSDRCRGILLAPRYCFEVLKKNIWRQTFHVMPLVIVGYIIPSVLQVVAIFLTYNMTFALISVGVAVVLQCVMCGILWMYIVPDFFLLEEQSGIQTKIKEMMEKAMRDFQEARKVKQNKENEIKGNNQQKERTDDKIAEDEQENDKRG